MRPEVFHKGTYDVAVDVSRAVAGADAPQRTLKFFFAH
jgi:hypothetical protein